MRTIPRKE